MRTETDNTWSAITLLVCLLLAALCLLIVDGGTPVDLGRPTPTGQTYATPFPALTPGTHTITICAENVAGRSCAAPLSVAVVVVPTTPTQVRIGSTGGA